MDKEKKELKKELGGIKSPRLTHRDGEGRVHDESYDENKPINLNDKREKKEEFPRDTALDDHEREMIDN